MLAYGQTGTGKTHTMEGFKYNGNDPQRGIVPRAMEEIFRYIQMQQNQNTTFMVRASYLQIYNEAITVYPDSTIAAEAREQLAKLDAEEARRASTAPADGTAAPRRKFLGLF